MNHSRPLPEDHSSEQVEALVRAHLDRQSEKIDPRPRFHRIIQHRKYQDCETPSRTLPTRVPNSEIRNPEWKRSVFRMVWGLGLAAAVLLVTFFSGWYFSPAHASAKKLVQEARGVHRLPVDRCYLVEVARTPALPDRPHRVLQQIRSTRLWTRGDRFWIESTNPRARWAWGRDEQGTVWFAPRPRFGVRLAPDEVPRWLNQICDIHIMNLDRLLTEVLRDFDLWRGTTNEDTLPTAHVVHAKLKDGHRHPVLRSARLEIDSETKVLRRVVLVRSRPGLPTLTTTYTLVESDVQEDDRYTLEGHLQEPFEVFSTRHQPHRRYLLLRRLFGPRAVRWFRQLRPAVGK